MTSSHKYDLLRDQLSITMHEAARLQPASAHPAIATNAAERIFAAARRAVSC
jgi:hypothetical protein